MHYLVLHKTIDHEPNFTVFDHEHDANEFIHQHRFSWSHYVLYTAIETGEPFYQDQSQIPLLDAQLGR